VLGQLPRADTGLHDLVGMRGRVHKIGDPGVPNCALVLYQHGQQLPLCVNSLPAGLNVGCVVFGLLVVDPSCAD
jgi:hypothetical protein